MAELSLHDLFAYDEESPSGLTWKITANNSTAKAGRHAGKMKKYGSNTYWSVAFNKKQYKAHRIVWEIVTGEMLPSENIIDHKDGNGLNNHIQNLRVINKAINSRNSRPRGIKTTSGLPSGICIHSDGLSYRARVSDLNGKRISKSFSLSKHGPEKALQLAEHWRESRIKELNELGAGYTDRHGK
ncbi:HNH endonuclease signature motif containing protein [Pantoea sp.]|uniref:HNH endonuclease signature motif containing protein n=1 Tax=Pantoea sp. TaxID=69393 RepID=UPI00290194A9|nr:HNH endonuclease signature motif containing protein [Pantoea sp.]MDU2728652.1 HNH endonuclease signature motif containing protein [Pantoea sp.]